MKTYYVAGIPYSDELYHHGVKNQRKGVRRYQNYDGSYTPLGRIHYGIGQKRYTNPDGTLNEEGKRIYGDETRGEENRKKMFQGASRLSTGDDDTDGYKSIKKHLGKRGDNFEKKIYKANILASKAAETDAAHKEYFKAKDALDKNFNPFKMKKLRNDFNIAKEKNLKAWNKWRTIMHNVTIEEIDKTFSKKERDYAMRMVYLYMGYDW